MSTEYKTTTASETADPSIGDQHDAHGRPRPVITRIIVNGQRKEVEGDRLSFEQAVSLAYNGNPPEGPGWEFTVGYRRGPREKPEGSLTAGHSVKIVNDEVFNVTGTDKS
jgi:Multiubiquitin